MKLNVIKYLVIGLIMAISFQIDAQTNIPAWVKAKPSSMIYYTGVGMAKKSDKDFMKKAKSAALNDLISEIQVEVSSNSILKKQEVNFKYSDSFEQDIRTKATADIEQFELAGTWSNSKEYWVYYQLDKQKYEEIMKNRIETAARKAFDFWTKGLAQQQAGSIMSAAEFFAKGIEVITPYINKDLSIQYEGNTYDMGTELYNSLNTVFNGIAITCDKPQIELSHFGKGGETIQVLVSANGIAVPGMKLKAKFATGGGTVNIPSTTDASGIALMTISNIVSKNQNQTVNIEIDKTPFNAISSGILKDVVAKALSTLPIASVSITSTQAPLKAVLYGKNTDNEQLLDAIGREIAQNYFDITKDDSQADVMIGIETKYVIGAKVRGELYNMVETFTTGTITITDLSKNTIITKFGVDNIRSLSPESDSVERSRNTANRELLKRLRPIFVKKMSEANITPRAAEEATTEAAEEEDCMPTYE